MHVISDGCIYKILPEHNLYIDSISALQMQPFRSPNRDSDYENKVDAIGVLFNLHTITSMGVVTIVPKKTNFSYSTNGAFDLFNLSLYLDGGK